MTGREEHRLRRVARMGEVSDILRDPTQKAVSGDHGALESAIKQIFQQEYEENLTEFVSIRPFTDAWSWFMDKVRPAIRRIGPSTDPKRVADWLGTAVVNAAKVAAHPSGARAMWLSRRDDRVRPTHVEADGQTVKWGEPFHVCGQEMLFPGQPIGDPACWLNCRCVVADASLFTMSKENTMTAVGIEDDDLGLEEQDWLDDMDSEDYDDEDTWEMELPTIYWHGVLAPEGTQSGDRRSFSPGSLTWRDLPLPLRRQPADIGGHDGAVVVATINSVRREGPLIRASGPFLETQEADDVIGLMAEGGVGGISVDVDDAELASEGDGGVEFGKGRICAATLVDIPAFAEAFAALGPDPDEPLVEPALEEMSQEPVVGPGVVFKDYNAEQRRDMAKKGWALPDGSFPIADEEDLRNAIHAIGRAKDPGRAKAHIKKRASALGKSDLIPESWTADTIVASADVWARGPGWVTNPKETRRIHAYWTKPGHKGYAKIRWGTPGDFRRLRRALSKYVSPTYLNRVAAQWHHDALGYWPGECGKPGNPPCGMRRHGLVSGVAAESVVLAAAVASGVHPTAWFTDPGLEGPTPLTVDGNRVYGHLATWGTCHIGVKGICTTPPRSNHNYAYFCTGSVLTEDGPVAVGQITMDTGHADLASGYRGATSHYDNTGTCVADVACGEDEYGIWVAGALREPVTKEERHALQAGALSGDWRVVGGNLELVAALVVNVPGFPIPRVGLAASAGVQTSLTAAGVVPCPGVPAGLVTAVADELEARASRRMRAAVLTSTFNEERIAVLSTAMSLDGG